MYPIIINREPKKIRYEKIFDIQDPEMTISELRNYVKGSEKFYIDNENHKIEVTGYRLETKKETLARVNKEETYMKNYTEFHNKK